MEVALARFDRAVKESSIRSDQIGQEKGRTQLLAEKPEDIASRIAVEARGGRPSGESSYPLSFVDHGISGAISMCNKRATELHP